MANAVAVEIRWRGKEEEEGGEGPRWDQEASHDGRRGPARGRGRA